MVYTVLLKFELYYSNLNEQSFTVFAIIQYQQNVQKDVGGKKKRKDKRMSEHFTRFSLTESRE